MNGDAFLVAVVGSFVFVVVLRGVASTRYEYKKR